MKSPDRRPVRDLVLGLAISAALVLLKAAVETGEFGKQLEQMTYNILQLRLVSHAGTRPLDVAIVDISGLTPVPIEYGGKTQLVAPREPLRQLIQSIAAEKPRAVGIDLDFSPGEFGFMTPSDPVLLQFFLDLTSQGIPVHVGIFDSIVMGPAKWLGRPEFSSLAAYLTVPNPEHTEPASRMVEWVRPLGSPEPCYSLSYALAKSERKRISPLLRWAIVRAGEKREREFSASEFLIDYGALDQLLNDRLLVEGGTLDSRDRARLTGKIVLVGRATPGQSTDQFVVPGHGTPIPGIYVHASAVHTLMQAPLYHFTPIGRVSADILAALMVFGPIFFVGIVFRRRILGRVAERRLFLVLTMMAIIVVGGVGQILVHTIRLIWTDHLMVIGALMLHSPVERVFGRFGARLQGLQKVKKAPGVPADGQNKKEAEGEDDSRGLDSGGPAHPEPAGSAGESPGTDIPRRDP